jgi:ParB-like chromosome segregation protein Spo0J
MALNQSTNSGDVAARLFPNGTDAPLQVEYRSVASLIPYARNARTHTDAQVAQIAASITEFGWTNPVLVDGDNGVIAGHGRLLAARKLGMADVPVIELGGMSEAQKRAYILADNKLALNAGWDETMLALEVGELSALGVDMTLAGFSDRELLALAASQNSGLTDPDETPEPPVEPVTKPGDHGYSGATA